MGLLSLPYESIIEVPTQHILGRVDVGTGATQVLTLSDLDLATVTYVDQAVSSLGGSIFDATLQVVALSIDNDVPFWRDQNTIDNFVISIGLGSNDDVVFRSVNGQRVNSIEQIYNISGTTDPVPNLTYKRITVDATSSTGNFNCTLTPPSGSMEGRLIIKNHTTPRIITISVSSGDLKWAGGVAHQFENDGIGSVVHLYWAYDSSTIYLAVTEVFS